MTDKSTKSDLASSLTGLGAVICFCGVLFLKHPGAVVRFVKRHTDTGVKHLEELRHLDGTKELDGVMVAEPGTSTNTLGDVGLPVIKEVAPSTIDYLIAEHATPAPRGDRASTSTSTPGFNGPIPTGFKPVDTVAGPR